MLSQNIKRKMEELNISIYELSKKSNLGYATVYDIVNGNTSNPRMDTVTKISNGLDEPIGNLIRGDNREKSYFENKSSEEKT